MLFSDFSDIIIANYIHPIGENKINKGYKIMIPKKEPKFKLGLTEEEITPRAGLAMYHESLDRSGSYRSFRTLISVSVGHP